MNDPCSLQYIKSSYVSVFMKSISERLIEYSMSVINLCSRKGGNYSELHIKKQLVRSATSSGANYQESFFAESRKDWIHKIKISLKELNESLYWLKLLYSMPGYMAVNALIDENEQLIKILSKSVITAEKKLAKPTNS